MAGGDRVYREEQEESLLCVKCGYVVDIPDGGNTCGDCREMDAAEARGEDLDV